MRCEVIGSCALYLGDCLDVLDHVGIASVHAAVMDPPYHLASILKRFGAANAAPAKVKETGVFARSSENFIGQTWDDGDIAFRVETWKKIASVLRPGAHLAAFAAPTNYHRMAVAIEDAGFTIRDMLSWLYVTGMPKNHPLDGDWEGWVAGKPKPAKEPIALARMPLAERSVAANMASFQTGAVHLDACKAAGDRVPANVLHDGSVEIFDALPGSRRDILGVLPCIKPSRAERDFGLAAGERNRHATVKPVALMQWLCRLITPPGGLVLDPFMGSGTTGMAAVSEGFRFIGIERDEAFFEIAVKRVNAAHEAMQNSLSLNLQPEGELA
jgi:site-specific DNA-methyltransferase (adenine-specific)